MTKFRVHTFQANRYTYEIEADDALAAQKHVSQEGWSMTPVEINTESPEWLPVYIVDPLLPSGEVDYDNVQHFDESSEEYPG